MTTKQVHAIRLKLHTQNDCSVIVWPDNTGEALYSADGPAPELVAHAGRGFRLAEEGRRQDPPGYRVSRVVPSLPGKRERAGCQIGVALDVPRTVSSLILSSISSGVGGPTAMMVLTQFSHFSSANSILPPWHDSSRRAHVVPGCRS